MRNRDKKTVAELQNELVRLKTDLKKQKKETLKKITNKKYAVKRSKFLTLKDSPTAVAYSIPYLQVSPKKVLSHISETPYFQKGDFVLYSGLKKNFKFYLK